jgi:hypothetical protein
MSEDEFLDFLEDLKALLEAGRVKAAIDAIDDICDELGADIDDDEEEEEDEQKDDKGTAEEEEEEHEAPLYEAR